MATSPPPTATGSSKVDAAKAKLAAADPTAPTGLALYSRFAFAGAVCCSVTHGALTPVDVYVGPPFNGVWQCQWLCRTRFCDS
jgi:solute carrier family 25 phosphate transporter 3